MLFHIKKMCIIMLSLVRILTVLLDSNWVLTQLKVVAEVQIRRDDSEILFCISLYNILCDLSAGWLNEESQCMFYGKLKKNIPNCLCYPFLSGAL